MTRIEPSPASAEAGLLFARFVELIARLRAPGGCPWDREQTHESVKPMTIEEAYEVAHAIDEKDDAELAGELGDLLLQVVFHANIAEERGAFRLKQIIERVSEKMVRRHPHVFGDDSASTSGEVLRSWEAIKAQERAAKGKDDESMLDSVHKGLPAVMEAFQMTTKVSRVGFDWKEADGALVKLDEEVLELREAIAAKTDPADGRRGGRRPALRRGERGAPDRGRPRERPQVLEPQVPPAVPAHRGPPPRRGPQARRLDPRGDGPPLGRGEGARARRGAARVRRAPQPPSARSSQARRSSTSGAQTLCGIG